MKKVMLFVLNVELNLMSFESDPTKIIKDGIIFALVGQVVAFVTKRVANFADDLPNNDEYEEFEDEQ